MTVMGTRHRINAGLNAPGKRQPVLAAVPARGSAAAAGVTGEDALRALAQFGPASYVANLDGEIIYASPRYVQYAEDAHGKARDPLKPAFPIDEEIANIIAGEPEVSKRVGLRIDGSETYFHARHFPIYGADGTLAGVGGIYRESSREWDEMRFIRDRYQDISRLSFDIIWETDGDFRITYISPRITEVLGFHPREMIGQSLMGLGTTAQGPSPLTAERRSPFRDVAMSVTHRDGRIRQLRLSGLPIFNEDTGAFTGFRGTATDTSAEHEARASAITSRDRLTMAIENISEGFALYDDHTRLLLCNSRFREYLGSAKKMLFPGVSLSGILHGLAERGILATPDETLDAWLPLREKAERDGEATIEVHLSEGRWLRVTDRPTEGGGIVSIVSDITETHERESALRNAKELAEQGSRSKSEFLANMSHELRTPLNAIIGFSQIMRAETLGPIGSPRYIEYLNDIIESSEHLLGVINDILDVAKSEAGKIDLYEEIVDIGAEVLLTGRLFAEQAAEAGVTLVAEPSRGLPKLWSDQRKIRQILLNLVSNAIKFTPSGGRVSVIIEPDDDGGLVLAVTDTGIGIRKEDVARAMAPFGQVESSLSRRYEGTGLGLPLTQALVERHGGRLVLDSEPGKGTRVAAHFPAERVRA